MNNNAKELLKLMTENPTLPVIPMVSYDVCLDDGYSYWLGSVGICRIGKIASYNDKIFEDEEDLKEEYYYCNEDNYKNMTTDEVEKDLEEKTKDMWVKCIIVHIETPEEVSNED